MFGNIKSKSAFTLSEVLITLGIIGVVAAMTMPTLIKNYQKHVTLNKLKSTYTILNNAIEMAKTEYGVDVNSWDMPNVGRKVDSEYFAKTYLMPYLKILNKEPASNNGYYFTLVNGVYVAVVSFSQSSSVADSRIRIDMYINGKKSSYKNAREVFSIELGGGTGQTGLDKNKFWPYAFGTTTYRGTLKTNCINNSAACFALIMFDNWKIKNDYPW